MAKEIILTKIISDKTNSCDYRLVKYKIKGAWTRPLLEHNQEKQGWHLTELFEHFSHGDIAYMNKIWGLRFGIGCFDEELIQTDELVEFKESA